MPAEPRTPWTELDEDWELLLMGVPIASSSRSERVSRDESLPASETYPGGSPKELLDASFPTAWPKGAGSTARVVQAALALSLTACNAPADGAREEPWAPAKTSTCPIRGARWCDVEDAVRAEDSQITDLVVDSTGSPIVAGLRLESGTRRIPFIQRYEPSGEIRWSLLGEVELGEPWTHFRLSMSAEGKIVGVVSQVQASELRSLIVNTGPEGESLRHNWVSADLSELTADAGDALYGVAQTDCGVANTDCLYVVTVSKNGQFDEHFAVGSGDSTVGAEPQSLLIVDDGSMIVSGRIDSHFWLARHAEDGETLWEHVGLESRADLLRARALLIEDDQLFVLASTPSGHLKSEVLVYSLVDGDLIGTLSDVHATQMISVEPGLYIASSGPDILCQTQHIDARGVKLGSVLPSVRADEYTLDCPALALGSTAEHILVGGSFRASMDNQAWLAEFPLRIPSL